MGKKLVQLMLNIGGTALRHDTLEGRDHLVVPCVSLKEEILHGSGGPGFYPADENHKSVAAWNGMPVVVYHTTDENNNHVSARDPFFFNTRKIGVIFNSEVASEGRVKHEVWLDYTRTKEVDNRIIESLEANKPVEVSTGLYVDAEDKKGTWNNKSYDWIARDYKPDHLAILPDQVGALPVSSGGGLLANKDEKIATAVRKDLGAIEQYLATTNHHSVPLEDFGDPDARTFAVRNQEDLDKAVSLSSQTADPQTVQANLYRIAKRKGLTCNLVLSDSKDMSLMDQHRAVADAIRKKHAQPGYDWNGWIEEVYDGHAVYRTGSRWDDSNPDNGMFRQKYQIGRDNEVKLVGDPVAVKRVVQYQDVKDGSYVGNASKCRVTSQPEEEFMAANAFDRNSHIGKLIGNGWVETDRKALEALSDDVLKKISPHPAPASPPPVAPPVVNTNPSGQDFEQWLNGAPVAFKAVYNQVIATANAQKDQCIKIILANENNVFREDYLKTLELPQLQGMARLAAKPAEPTGVNNMFIDPAAVGGIYGGAGGHVPGFTIANANPTQFNSEPLEIPPMFGAAGK